MRAFAGFGSLSTWIDSMAGEVPGLLEDDAADAQCGRALRIDIESHASGRSPWRAGIDPSDGQASELEPSPMQVSRTRAELVLQLFDDFYERVYAFLRKSTTPEVAEDLAQEVFVRLLQHPELERLTITASYLIKIAHNLLRRRYARATRLRELLEERSGAGHGPAADGAGEREPAGVPLALDARLLDAAMGLLSSDEHSAVRLIVCEGRSYQHAAQSLGVTVTTINNWKHRGLTKMRRYLAEAERGGCAGHHALPDAHEDPTSAERVGLPLAGIANGSTRRAGRDLGAGTTASRITTCGIRGRGDASSRDNATRGCARRGERSGWLAAHDDVA